MKQFPSLLKSSNNGKGSPLIYVLLPLSTIFEHFQIKQTSQRVLQELDSAAIDSIVDLFDNFAKEKLLFRDFYAETLKYKDFLLDATMNEIQLYKCNLNAAEYKLRADLQQLVSNARSGQDESKEKLMNHVQTFLQKSDYSPFAIQRFVTTKTAAGQLKMQFVKEMQRNNVAYIAKTSNMYDGERDFDKYYVLVYSSSPDLRKLGSSMAEFRKLIAGYKQSNSLKTTDGTNETNQLKSKIPFMVIDADIRPDICLSEGIPTDACVYVHKAEKYQSLSKHGKHNDTELEANSLPETVSKKSACASDSDSDSDSDFHLCPEEITERNVPLKVRSDLQTLRHVNILVVGETGVGKSTWINCIANYASYNSIKKAVKAKELLCLIPMSLFVNDGKCKQKTIWLGKQVGQQQTSTPQVGHSDTTEPASYVFQVDNTTVRLIDTPGVGRYKKH